MGYYENTITSVDPPAVNGTEILISWQTTAPAGTIFQVYLDLQLADSTTDTAAAIGWTAATTPRIDVISVDPEDLDTDFSAALSAATPLPLRTATLTWIGGTFEGSDIDGFNIYAEATPGGGINYTTAFDTVDAYEGGIVVDGFGLGGFGLGGFGEASSDYSWQSGDLTSGTWNFAVAPYDVAGNVGPAQTIAITIEVPPAEPGLFGDGTRLHYSYNPTTFEATLTWTASTG